MRDVLTKLEAESQDHRGMTLSLALSSAVNHRYGRELLHDFRIRPADHNEAASALLAGRERLVTQARVAAQFIAPLLRDTFGQVAKHEHPFVLHIEMRVARISLDGGRIGRFDAVTGEDDLRGLHFAVLGEGEGFPVLVNGQGLVKKRQGIAFAERDTGRLDEFRQRFGDERVDYGDALSSHYGGSGPSGWEDRYVSAYATMHPWEDWAETFAHYLHLRDTLQTATEMGVKVADPAIWGGEVPLPEAEHGPFDELVREWIALAGVLNAVNRSMGAGDLYPFVLAPTVIDKLAYVDRLVRGDR